MTDKHANAEQTAFHTAEARVTSPGTGRIVVGVDGSAGSTAALEWAVQETRLRGGSVHAVVVWQHPRANAANAWGLGMDPSIDSRRGLASPSAEAARLGKQVSKRPGVAMTWEEVEGHPAQALVVVAENADLLVVGSRGHGGFVGLLLGSVSQHVVAHARCPVVVIPVPEQRHGA